MMPPLVTSLRHTTLVYVRLLMNKPLCVRRPLHCDLTVRGTLTSFGTRNSGDGELSAWGCKFILRYISRCIAHNAWSSTAKIANCKNDQKQLFTITRNLMGNTDITTMPSYVYLVDIAQRFGDHFIEKVSNIRKDIVEFGEDYSYTTMVAVFSGVPLVCFETVTESDVERLIASAPVKSCKLDPIPMWLLKQCSHEFTYHRYDKRVSHHIKCTC